MGLSAGLSTTVPDPVGDDGTGEGALTDTDFEEVDNITNNAKQYITSQWTLIVMWPVLLTVALYIIDTLTYLIKYTTDLCSHTSLINSEFDDPTKQGITEADIDLIIDLAAPLIAVGSILTAGLAVLNAAECQAFIEFWCPTLYAQVVFGLALIGIAIAFALSTVNTAIDEGRYTDGQAGWFFLLTAGMMLKIALGGTGLVGVLSTYLVTLCVIVDGWWNVLGTTWDFLTCTMGTTRYLAAFLCILFIVLAFYYWLR